MSVILALGGAHIDRRGRISGETAPGASNPGSWRQEAGGGVFNAARNLSRLGRLVTLISPRGGDAEGEAVAIAAQAAGVIDRPFTFLDRRTPSYTAILERDGNLVIALADMELYRLFSPRRLSVRAVRDAFAGTEAVLTDANLPEETLLAIAAMGRRLGKTVAAIGISPAKIVRFTQALPDLDFLFMNEAEAEALSGQKLDDFRRWPDVMTALGLKGGAITRGSREAVAWMGGKSACLSPPALASIGDVTGAGDGFAAGFFDSALSGASLEDCLRSATASARIALESEMAASEALSRSLLASTLALVPEAEILL